MDGVSGPSPRASNRKYAVNEVFVSARVSSEKPVKESSRQHDNNNIQLPGYYICVKSFLNKINMYLAPFAALDRGCRGHGKALSKKRRTLALIFRIKATART